ncbi:MAG TPA: ArsR family transcriptional regulator [Ktedonobacterales bacterium]|nr:ArsR family transcriptional regulator [Ktedonobacterales bacterium]
MEPNSERVQQAPAILKLLAHDLRWRVLLALSHTDGRVQEIAQQTGEPANLISYHLRQLRELRVVTEHRSAADGRDVYYSLDLPTLHALYVDAGAQLHPALRLPTLLDEQPSSTQEVEQSWHTSPSAGGEHGNNTASSSGDQDVRVLFLCTHNSARSQMAEAILRQLAHDRVGVMSAGSDPTGVDPLAIQVLTEMGIDISHQRAKHVNQLSAQHFSYVITLCDHMREVCPVFPGWPAPMHWSFPDPTLVADVGDARHQAFVRTALQLFTRIRYLLPVIEQEHFRAA